MINKYQQTSNLNQFFQKIFLKKQYVKKLKNKINLLIVLKEQSYKTLSVSVFNNKSDKALSTSFIKYIIDISFSRSNTLLHIMDSLGNLKFFCSAGDLSYTGRNKKSRLIILKSFIRILTQKLKFIQNQPMALHLKNVKFFKLWIIKKLKKKIFIKVVKTLNIYPHNGCRKRKIRRKKIKKKVSRRNG